MLKNFKWLVLWLFVVCLFTATAGADKITIINSSLAPGGTYPWDTARADLNNNFDDLYIHWTLITVTSPVDLDTMDALIDANVIQISELVTLSGVPAHSTDLGTFPGGTTIPDNSDNKEALAALEVAVEATGPGVDENYVTDAELVTLGNQSGTNSGDATIGTANGLSFAGQVLSLAAATNGNPGAMTAAFVLNIESLITLSGVLADATDFGTFTGVTIPDGSTNKEALQALETAVEAGGGAFDPASPGEIGGTTPGIVNATELIVPFADGVAGVGWSDFNTAYTPAVGFTGVIPYINNLYKVLDGSIVGILGEIDDTAGDGDTTVTYSADKVVDLIAAVTAASITEVVATPDPWDMVAGDLYIAQDDGELSYLLADSSEVFRYAATSSTALFDMTLGIVDDGSITINGTAYTSVGSPHTITALSGATAMTALYGGTNDTLVFSGTDSGDVTGTYPNYSITMNAAKSIIGTFSQLVTCTGTGVIGNKVGTPAATNATFAFTQRYVAGTDSCITLGGIEHAAGLGGTAARLTVHANSGGVPGALLYTSNEMILSNVNEIEEVAFPSAFQVTNGVTYWIGYVADASLGYIYSTSTGEAYYFNDSYTAYPTPDDPFVGTLSGTTTRAAIIYLEDI